MTTQDLNQWPAQEPPEGFPDRAVAAMLTSRGARPRRRMERRWVAGLALAAVLAAAGAWGMVELKRSREPKAPAIATAMMPASATAPAASPPLVPVAAAVPSASQPTPVLATPPSAPVRPKPSASAAPAPSASAPGEKKIIVPRCECPPNEGFCTCVQ
jgi:hypothetical protein